MISKGESLFSFMPYGAPELKEVARKYMFRGVLVGSGGFIAVFLLSFGTSAFLLHRPHETSVVVVPYREIPDFPVSTVESHAGELHFGRLGGRPVALMKGRVHYYEGYSMAEVTFPVRVLKQLGDRKSTRLNSSHSAKSRMPSSA